MADITSAPLVPAPSASLWPQPPAQQPGFGSDPGKMLDLVTKMQQNYQLQQELKARAAIGQAYQGALQPDGTLDQERLRAGLNDPAASWLLPEAMTHVLNQQATQFNVRSAQDQAARALIGSLPPKATDEELRHYAVTGVRSGIPAPIMTGHVDSLMRLKGDERARAIAVLQGTALGPAGVSERVGGPPSSEGAPTMRSKGATILDEAGTRSGGYYGGTPTALSPAETGSLDHYQRDRITQANYSQELGRWLQAREAIQAYKAGGGSFGPGAEDWQKWVSFAQRSGIPAALGFDPNQVKNFNEAKKYMNAAVQMTQAGAHPSNDRLNFAVSSNPNVSVDDLALPELVDSQIAAMRMEYSQFKQAERAGPRNYSAQKSMLAPQYDIRAFRHDLMSPEDRTRLHDSLPDGSPANRRYQLSLEAAYDSGAMDRPMPARVTPTPAAAAPASAPVVVKRPGPGFVSSAPTPVRPAAMPDFAARDAALMAEMRRPTASAPAPIVPRRVAAVPAAPAAAVPSPHVGGMPAATGFTAGEWAGGGTPDMAGASAGQPGRATGPAPWPSPGGPQDLPAPPVHMVARGQTLDQVAKKFGVSPREIAIANGLGAEDKVRPGMRLTIPMRPPHPAAQWGRLPNGSMGWVVMHNGRWHQYVPGE